MSLILYPVLGLLLLPVLCEKLDTILFSLPSSATTAGFFMLLGGLMPVPVALLFSNGTLPVASPDRVDATDSAVEVSEPAFMLASISRSPNTELGVCR